MKVYTRFSDKATCITIIVCFIVSFIIGLAFMIYGLQTSQSYQEMITKCYASTETQCQVDLMTQLNLIRDTFLSIQFAGVMISSSIIGFLIVLLYDLKPVKNRGK